MFNIIAMSFWEMLEILGWGLGITAYLCGAFFIAKRTYDISTEEVRLLRLWYNAWIWSPFLKYKLWKLNSNHTSGYLSEKYKISRSEEDFLIKCSSLRSSGNGLVIIRY